MKKTTRRRLIALLLPLPILAAGAAFLRYGRPSRNLEVALTFPTMCFWYFGLRSMALAKAVALGYWYLLVAMACYAALCGRDRVSRALLVCVLATSAVAGAMMLILARWSPD